MGALLLLGLLWQWILGAIPPGAYGAPFNVVIASIVSLAAITVGVLSAKSGAAAWIRFLVSPAATVTVLTAFLLQLLVMGFMVQVSPISVSSMHGILHRMGWSSMIHSYPFNVTYLYLLLILGSVTVRRLMKPRRNLRWVGFVCNHLGLYIFLVFALLSGTDMKRYTMVLKEGSVEWRGLPYHDTELEELPIAIELVDFHMDEYPPKLMLLDGHSGEVLPIGAPQSMTVEESGATGVLDGWSVRVTELLPLAAPIMNGDSLVFTAFGSAGAAPAVRLTASRLGESHAGWVSAGSHLFPFRALGLSDDLSIVMPTPEPKQYYSKVDYYLKSGEKGSTTISVNHPLSIGQWYIYQLNYNREMGKWSDTSELELVYDSWLPGVYVGIGLLFLGAMLLLLGPVNVPSNLITEE